MFRTSGDRDDLASRRQELIEDLSTKIQLLGLSVTLVFDSQYQIGDSERTHFQDLEIIFTDHGETADERIVEEIKSEKYPASKITVVTSDKKLAWFARRSSAATIPAEVFIIWLNKRCSNLLRKRKEGIVKKKPLPVVVTPKKNIEIGSDDFYLKEFESRLSKIEAEKPPPKLVKKSKQKRKKIETPPDDDASKSLLDMERWLHIFERNLGNSKDVF